MAERVNDVIRDDVIEHQVDLLRGTEAVWDEVDSQLDELLAALSALIVNINPTGVQRTRFRVMRTERLVDESAELIRESYRNIARESSENLLRLSALESIFSTNVVAGALGVEPTLRALSVAELSTVIASDAMIDGATTDSHWQKQAANLAFAYGSQIREGVARDESAGTLVDRARDTMDRASRDAESLTRTMTISTANAASLATYKTNEDIIKGITWISTLDTRTSDICKALDGLRWNTDREPIGHKKEFPGPTAHFRCRSTQAPYTKSLAEIEGTDSPLARRVARDIPEGTRSSIDGRVSRSTTYEQFLQKKERESPGYALEKGILTRGKYVLWKQGKISFRDLIDQKGNPLTLEELEDKVGRSDYVKWLKENNLAA